MLLANLEDGVPAADKEAARAGLVDVARAWDPPDTQLWTRVNALDSPWGLDDLVTAVAEAAAEELDVDHDPEGRGPRTSTTWTGCWPSWRPRPGSTSRC